MVEEILYRHSASKYRRNPSIQIEITHAYQRPLLAPKRDYVQLAYLLRQDFRRVFDQDQSQFPEAVQKALALIREGKPVPEVHFSDAGQYLHRDGEYMVSFNTGYRVQGYLTDEVYVLDYSLLNIERYEDSDGEESA